MSVVRVCLLGVSLFDPAPYPHILRYLKRISEREAYQRAMHKGDPGMTPLLTWI
jgi:glutathione S-transferase